MCGDPPSRAALLDAEGTTDSAVCAGFVSFLSCHQGLWPGCRRHREDTGRVLESLRTVPQYMTPQDLSFHLGCMLLLAPNTRTPSHTLGSGWRPLRTLLEPLESLPAPSSLQCSLLKPSGHIEGHFSKNLAHCFPELLWSITKALKGRGVPVVKRNREHCGTYALFSEI